MKKALFLDRDGTINETIKRGDQDDSPFKVEDLKFKEGIKDLVMAAKKKDFEIIVVTNQPSVLKGNFELKEYEKITSEIANYLEIPRENIFECLHKEGLSSECGCRKPKNGLFLMAKGMHSIDLGKSIMVGDSWRDMVAADEVGIFKKIFLVCEEDEDHHGNGSSISKLEEIQLKPDKIVKTLNEVTALLNEIGRLRYDKLEMGCGGKPSGGYLHQDVTLVEGTDLDYLCNPWEVDISENKLSEVLALGVMEHIRYEDFRKTLRHMFKILKKGGEFLFDVPDMKVWSEYLYNLTHGQSEKNPFPNEHIWATIYGWQRWPGDEHKSGWTKESLLREIKEAGFSGIVEGVEVYTSKGIKRGRFTREGDAHIYIKAIK